MSICEVNSFVFSINHTSVYNSISSGGTQQQQQHQEKKSRFLLLLLCDTLVKWLKWWTQREEYQSRCCALCMEMKKPPDLHERGGIVMCFKYHTLFGKLVPLFWSFFDSSLYQYGRALLQHAGAIMSNRFPFFNVHIYAVHVMYCIHNTISIRNVLTNSLVMRP